MQDANLLLDPRGRTRTPYAIAPSMRASESLSSGLAQSEQQGDTLENPNTQPNDEDAHIAWSAHMREHKSAETNIENIDSIEPPSEAVADAIRSADSIVETSNIVSNSRAEILSPHYQLAKLGTPTQPESTEIQRLEPEGSFSELPNMRPDLPKGLIPADTHAVTDIHVIDTHLDNVSQDTSVTHADTKADLKINLDNKGNRTESVDGADNAIMAIERVLDKTLSPRLDPAIGAAAQRREADLDTKIAAVNFKQSEGIVANLDPQSPDSKTKTHISGDAYGDTVRVDAVKDHTALNLRATQTDLAPLEDSIEDSIEDSLENVRFSEIVNLSTEDLAKNSYLKTGNATATLGLASGLTDPTLALETSQFSLGAMQSVTPSAQTAASLAINAVNNVPTLGPNTVAIISDAMLMAKETAKGVTVQLDPPEMGRVYIDFIFEADRPVNIIVKTETLEAQHMLRERSDDFLALLKEEGLDGATLSFEFHDNQGFEGFDHHSFSSEPSNSLLASDDHHQSPPHVQNSDSKTISYTDGLDLRL